MKRHDKLQQIGPHIARTPIYITDEADVLAISRAHGRVFGDIKPANTLVRVAGLIGDLHVEVEAEAIVRAATGGESGQ
jgi:enamine deaminase RidA (YjgF/YER057c/UK114 family)